MKLKLCLLPLLCLFLNGFAQDKQHTITSVGIGQKVPDILISNIDNYQIAGKPVRSLHLSHFAGKLLIIDFWATWCSPCRAMVPVMDSLQKAFAGKIQFLPVTYQSAAIAAPVVRAMKKDRDFNLLEVTSDHVLAALFPHRSLPHYVWIDAYGIVRAITEFKEVNAANISRLLLTGRLDVPVKTDLKIAYNSALPFLISGNAGDGNSLKYHSLLTGYIPGISGGQQITAFDSIAGQKFTVRNAPFVNLCKFVYQDDGRFLMNAQVKVLSKDSLRMNSKLSGQAYDDWEQRGNGYCYELLLPPALAANAFPIMQQDLQRLFPQYAVSIEPQQTRCLALIRIPGTPALSTAGGKSAVAISPYSCKLVNTALNQLMLRLRYQYLQNSALPVIDLSGYKTRVDLAFEAKLWDIASLNKALLPVGLQFVEKDAVVDMLIIRDASPALRLNTKQPNP